MTLELVTLSEHLILPSVFVFAQMFDILVCLLFNSSSSAHGIFRIVCPIGIFSLFLNNNKCIEEDHKVVKFSKKSEKSKCEEHEECKSEMTEIYSY